jgi:glycosyltransferase involved in cell wall biosynthesis
MILIFTQYFTPAKKAGGPITSITNMIEQLDIDFKVVARGHDLNESKVLSVELNQWTNNNSRWYVGFGMKSIFSFIQEIRKQRKQTFYINGLFDFKLNFLPILFGKKLIVAPRGMLQKGALQNGHLKKRTYLALLQLVLKTKRVKWHATDLVEAMDITTIFGEQEIEAISNLIAVPKEVKLNSSKKQDQLRLVYFSLIAEKKNLLFLLECMAQSNADIYLDVVGPIKDQSYFERCKAFIDLHPKLLEKVCFNGPAEANFMQVHAAEYDYFVLPTKGENFGHAIIESLANGLPVLISDSTPWNFDQASHSGLYSLPLNQEDWQNTLKEVVKQNAEQHQVSKRMAIEYFNKNIASKNEATKHAYLQLFEK